MPRPSTLRVVHAARSLTEMPDGTALTSTQKHALVTLATYYPNIWPSQSRLAADMSITRRNVNRRLKELEAMGLVKRDPPRFLRERSTRYELNLKILRPMQVEVTSDDDDENVLPF